MTNQSSPLPKTLPAGTRSKSGETALSELRLTDGRYVGRWRSSWNGDYEGSLHVANVVWTEVPITPPIEDRPIQAGDWVECVESCGTPTDGTSPGERFAVAKVTTFFAVPGLELKGRQGVWLASRFKRVDGPHPALSYAKAEREMEAHLASINSGRYPSGVDAPCSELPNSVAPAVPDTGLLRECDHCGESVGCAENCVTRADEPRPDPYTAHRLAMEPDSMCFLEPSDAALKARARNEAALRREAERPRGNPAERKSLAAGHPASWPSNEGED